MTWWLLLIIIGAYIVAVVIGSIFGRILAHRWAFPFSRHKRDNHKQNASNITPPIQKAEYDARDARQAKEQKEREAKEGAERVAWELEKEKKNREAREKATLLAAEARREREANARLVTEQQAKEAAEKLTKEKAERTAREAANIARQKAEETRLAKEARDKALLAAEQQAREKATQLAREKAEQGVKEKSAVAEQAKLAAEKLTTEQVNQGGGEITQKTPPRPYADVLAEINANISIASAPPNTKPVPFRTEIWDTKSTELGDLPVHLQHELGEAYTDIRLANNIVWLVTEVGATSPDFYANYSKLCQKITERLSTVLEYIKSA